ncbi:MAG: 4-hydroxythreonine-4-phosphate dehydrogenase [Vicingaceae bacterium]|nr:MAG: 4-hydroxythreonine-4-phosphate dehydrogenase [Vicingaceae bacterium]
MQAKNNQVNNQVILGITIGDLNGIGPELVFKILSDTSITEIFTPVVYCGMKTVSWYKKRLGLNNFNPFKAPDIKQVQHGKVNIISLWDEDLNIQPGTPDASLAKYAFLSLKAATIDIKRNYIHAMTTAPIDKSLIAEELSGFTGHTEYLAGQDQNGRPLMIMVGDLMKVATATTHVPLKEVASRLDKDSILQSIVLLNDSLKRDFLIPKPKIAVLGLNPHAGDNGLIGKEEKDFIIPAILDAKKENIIVLGPYSADAFFGTKLFNKFDGILAMYHDQGLAPFKLLEHETGVNFTAGLSFVRTSPDHGPAFDIAGKNIANPTSFRHAMFLAKDIYLNRIHYREMYSNPLQTKTSLTIDAEEQGNNN